MKGINFILAYRNNQRLAARKEKITYDTLAKACGLKSRSSVRNWINGKPVKEEYLNKMSEILDFDKEYLFKELTTSEIEKFEALLSLQEINIDVETYEIEDIDEDTNEVVIRSITEPDWWAVERKDFLEYRVSLSQLLIEVNEYIRQQERHLGEEMIDCSKSQNLVKIFSKLKRVTEQDSKYVEIASLLINTLGEMFLGEYSSMDLNLHISNTAREFQKNVQQAINKYLGTNITLAGMNDEKSRKENENELKRIKINNN